MSRTPSRYERRGLLAVDPSAFYELFLGGDSAPPNRDLDTHTEVYIRGPLEAEPGWCWDSYPAIEARIRAACERTAPAIVMRIDSPGGDVTGCFELARVIRSMVESAGKTLYAYVDGHACSAAYALACVATGGIYACETAILGSIGVICTRWDYSEQNALSGVRVAFISSGERKADGHADLPLSDAELAAQQRIIDATASVFFKLVSDMRGFDPQPLQAGIYLGADALGQRLADKIIPLDALVTIITSGASGMADPLDEARKALEEAAAGGNEAAKRALAAWDQKEDADTEGDDPDTDAEDEDPDTDAEDETDPDKDKDSAAAAMKIAREALAELHKMKAQHAAERTASERTRLIASRPDLSPALVATLATAPLTIVRDLVKTLPKVTGAADAGAQAALAASQVQATAGGDAGGRPGMLPPAERHNLDLAMGLVKPTSAVVNTDYRLTLGATNLVVQPPANGGV